MNQLYYVISYFFQLYLMFYACIRKFDVTVTAQIFLKTKRTLSRHACTNFNVRIGTRITSLTLSLVQKQSPEKAFAKKKKGGRGSENF